MTRLHSRPAVLVGAAGFVAFLVAVAVWAVAGRGESTAPTAPVETPSAVVPSPLPGSPTSGRTPPVPTVTDLVITVGATRAETLREVERQSGITVAIPWLPEGLEVTGARTTVACVPTCTRSAQFNVSGPRLAGFALEQVDRPSSNSAGTAIPGAPPGFAFYRREGQPAVAAWMLTSDAATYSLTAGPAATTLDNATVLRILLGMAGHQP